MSSSKGDAADRDVLIAECLSQAEALPPSQRASFVHQFFATDQDAAQVVLGLLSDEKQGHAFSALWSKIGPRAADRIPQAGDIPAAGDTPDNLGATTDHIPGQSNASPQEHRYSRAELPDIPGHRLTAVLGEGGMGIVVEGFDDRLQVNVAIKLMRGGLVQSERARTRFLNEARAVAKLRHPNIVGVLREGETDQGVLWFSMEHIEGRSLDKLVPPGGMAIEQAVDIVRDIAKGLACAHRANIFHRDIKPGNVLIDKDGQVKVVDFGLAKNVEVAEGVTQAGHAVGTPKYMAPEQIDHTLAEISPATDVYATGVLLYYLLTKTTPFQFDQHLELFRAVLRSPPQPPRKLRGDIPRDLDSICLKCLEKAPGQRYTTAEALIADLDRFAAGQPVQARPIDPVRRAVRWAKRNPLPVAVLASLFMGIVFSTYFARRAAHGESLAEDRAISLADQKAEVSKQAAELSKLNESMRQELYGANVRDAARNLRDGRFDSAFRSIVDLIPDSGQIDRRGIEWRILWQQLVGPYRMRHATGSYFGSSIYHFSLRPDNRTLAYSIGGTAYLWDYVSGRLIGTIEGRSIPRYLSDNQTVLCVSDGRILICDADSFKPRLEIEVADTVRDMFSSSDGALFGVHFRQSEKSYIQIYATETGQLIDQTALVSTGCRKACFSTDDKLIATANSDHKVRLHQIGGEQIAELKSDYNPIGVDFSKDGRFLVACPLGYKAQVWETETWSEVANLAGNDKAWRMAKFTPDCRYLMMAGYDGRIWQYDVQDWRLVSRHDADLTVWWGDISASGEHLVLGGATGVRDEREGHADSGQGVRVFHLDRDFEEGLKWQVWGEFRRDESLHSSSVDGNWICVANQSKNEILRQALPLQESLQVRIGLGSSTTTAIQSFGHGQYCGVIDSDGEAWCIDWLSRTKQKIQARDPVVKIYRDDSEPGSLWLLTSRGIIQYSVGSPSVILEADFSGKVIDVARTDGKTFVATAETIRCYDEHMQLRWEQSIAEGGITCIAPVDSDTTLVATSQKKIIRVSASGAAIWMDVVALPIQMRLTDGKGRLVVASSTKTVSIIDTNTRRVLLEIATGSVRGISVDPGGEWLVADGGFSQYFHAAGDAKVVDDLMHMANVEGANENVLDALGKQLRWMKAEPPIINAAAAIAVELGRQRNADSVRDRQQKDQRILAQERVVAAANQLSASSTNGLSGFWTRQILDRISVNQISPLEDPRALEASFAQVLAEMPPGTTEKLNEKAWLWLAWLDEYSLIAFDNHSLNTFDLLTGEFQEVATVPNRILCALADPQRGCVYVGTGGRWDAELKQTVNDSPATLLRFDTKDWSRQTLHQFDKGGIARLALSHAGDYLVATGEGTQGIRCHLPTQTIDVLEEIGPHAGIVNDREPGSLLVFESGKGLNIIDIANGKSTRRASTNVRGNLRLAKRLGNSNYVGVCAMPNDVVIVDDRDAKPVKRVSLDIGYEASMADGPDGQSVIVGTQDGSLVQVFADPLIATRSFEMASGKVIGLRVLKRHGVVIYSSPQGMFLFKLPTVAPTAQTPDQILSQCERTLELAIADCKPNAENFMNRFETLKTSYGAVAQRLESFDPDTLDDEQAPRLAALKARAGQVGQCWNDFMRTLPPTFWGRITGGRCLNARYVGEGQVVTALGTKLLQYDLFSRQREILCETVDELFSVAIDQERQLVYFGTGGKWNAEAGQIVNQCPAKLISLNLATREQKTLCQFPRGRVESLVLTADGSAIIGGGPNVGGFVLDVTSGEKRTLSSVSPRAVVGFAESATEYWVLESGGKLGLIDIATDKRVKQWELPLSGLGRSVVSLQGGKCVGCCSQAGEIVIVNIEDGTTVVKQQAKLDFFCELQAGPDGESLLVPTSSGELLQLGCQQDAPLSRFPIEHGNGYSILPVNELNCVIVAQSTGLYLANFRLGKNRDRASTDLAPDGR